jgi:hypothetical protein
MKAFLIKPSPRSIAYRATNVTGFVAYNGDGFAILLPSKWNPSKEQEYPGTALR